MQFNYGYGEDEEGNDLRNTQPFRTRADYKEKSHDSLLNKKSVNLETGNPIPENYIEKIKRDISNTTSGTKQQAQMQQVIPTELSSVLKENGIDIPTSAFTINFEDITNSGNNKFEIEVKDPFTGKIIRESFIYNKPNDAKYGSKQILLAMDEVINKIYQGSNQTSGRPVAGQCTLGS